MRESADWLGFDPVFRRRGGVHDYKKFCHQWGIETKGLKNCMHKHGDNLTHACVAALVQAGEVSQAEVNRRKAGK